MGNSIVQLIKRIAAEERRASCPCAVCFGKVVSASPLVIQADQKKILDEDFLIVTDRIDRLIRREKLKQGCPVLMVRQDGGQAYAVIDLVVGKDGGT